MNPRALSHPVGLGLVVFAVLGAAAAAYGQVDADTPTPFQTVPAVEEPAVTFKEPPRTRLAITTSRTHETRAKMDPAGLHRLSSTLMVPWWLGPVAVLDAASPQWLRDAVRRLTPVDGGVDRAAREDYDSRLRRQLAPPR